MEINVGDRILINKERTLIVLRISEPDGDDCFTGLILKAMSPRVLPEENYTQNTIIECGSYSDFWFKYKKPITLISGTNNIDWEAFE